jgi:hypothetical protein
VRVALTPDEVRLIERHHKQYDANKWGDELMARYAYGEQTIRHLGMAVPPSYRDFTFVLNWPGVYVESVESRQDVRALILPGESAADPRLVEMMDANNLDADLSLFLQDRYTFGRSFFSVGSNEDDPSTPLVHVESPREMTAFVDIRRRRMTSAAKFYGYDDTSGGPTNLTLYLPNVTVWAAKSSEGRWAEVDRDEHNLGRVPVTMSLCRRRSGGWTGQPLITRVNDITDSLARAMANMQFASEAAGIPQKYALGVSSGDFVDRDGNPLPQWAAYFNAIWANKNPNIKVGQFAAADLKNFETQVTIYGKLAASVTYLPSRYFGLTTTNPPSADAIRAEEAQFVKFVERQNAQVGSVLGWTAGLWWRFATGEWVDGSRIGVEWHDPATPTIAQREDALQKRRSAGVLSRQGYWDELGWSEQRKAKEQQYLDEEAATDPVLSLGRNLLNGTGNAPAGG